jgi:hypothetical protein
VPEGTPKKTDIWLVAPGATVTDVPDTLPVQPAGSADASE